MDVTRAIGIADNARGHAVAALDEGERILYQIQSGFRSVSMVSESGLYKLILRSDKEDAKPFQDWVTKVVLPSIRKTGGYLLNEGARRKAHVLTKPLERSRKSDEPAFASNDLRFTMNRYSHAEWKSFRNEMIEIAGAACERCHRHKDAGAVLQVHHKSYVPGKAPWEYPYELCEVLCKGCHAAEHGKVMPRTGWQCVGDDDLGCLEGKCDLCGTELRYVFLVQHEKWGFMEVGTNCCDTLTESTEASAHRAYQDKMGRFLQSPRWKDDQGRVWIKQGGATISIGADGPKFAISVNGKLGKRRFDTQVAAQQGLFDLCHSGRLNTYLSRSGPPR